MTPDASGSENFFVDAQASVLKTRQFYLRPSSYLQNNKAST